MVAIGFILSYQLYKGAKLKGPAQQPPFCHWLNKLIHIFFLFDSGGRKLTVSGTGLSVSRATMFVQHDKGMDNMFEEVSQILMIPIFSGISSIALL